MSDLTLSDWLHVKPDLVMYSVVRVKQSETNTTDFEADPSLPTETEYVRLNSFAIDQHGTYRGGYSNFLQQYIVSEITDEHLRDNVSKQAWRELTGKEKPQ